MLRPCVWSCWLSVRTDNVTVVGVDPHAVELAVLAGVEGVDVATAIIDADGAVAMTADNAAGLGAADAMALGIAAVAAIAAEVDHCLAMEARRLMVEIVTRMPTAMPVPAPAGMNPKADVAKADDHFGLGFSRRTGEQGHGNGGKSRRDRCLQCHIGLLTLTAPRPPVAHTRPAVLNGTRLSCSSVVQVRGKSEARAFGKPLQPMP